MNNNNNSGDLARSQSLEEGGNSELRLANKEQKPRCMSTEAMQTLYDLRQNNLLCDAILVLQDGGRFPVHKAILSACSDFVKYITWPKIPSENCFEKTAKENILKIMEWKKFFSFENFYKKVDENEVCIKFHVKNYVLL